MSIESNIAARKVAEECFTLISEYIREQSLEPPATGLAWRLVCDMVAKCTNVQHEAAPLRTDEMSDDDARRFERRKMEFGKYGPSGEGKTVVDVPLEYLAWIDEQPDFRHDLRRYLKRKQIWDQQTERG